MIINLLLVIVEQEHIMTQVGGDQKHTTFNNETYYPVGDVVIRQHDIVKGGDTQVGDIKWGQRHGNGPDMKTILVAGDVKDPIRQDTLVWHDASYWFGSYKYSLS